MKSTKNSSLPGEGQKYTSKGILLGVFLALLCNCMYLTSSILVKKYELLASEICFIRGILQMLAFLIVYLTFIFYRKYFESKKNVIVQKETKPDHGVTDVDWKLVLMVCLCGLSFGTMTLLAYIGVKLMPLSDFVVFGRTAPVFALILSAIVLR